MADSWFVHALKITDVDSFNIEEKMISAESEKQKGTCRY
jgi:hypothetical protein